MTECHHCGYKPRRSDRNPVEVRSWTREAGEDWVKVVHVVCYQCGNEWVE